MTKKCLQVGFTIGRDQKEWLSGQPILNLSGIVQQIIKEERRKPEPFHKAGRRIRTRKMVAVNIHVGKDDKEWLVTLRKSLPTKHFLSYYVQRRIDYIMKTGIIKASIEFRESL
jgi:hypothetical protein